eukprot:CAMPEP_0115859702 /NCGR_PEP_ID=MMETSP0287-20121206/16752_1 /TAXON_ID=412157 /ORGANISM="Chrysochromulina rotalis, Strain UIO044" /LENGTH=284 /DNA_ID=CAMNT_0003314011 /DNA_START=443 /DNA_END=1297 /DNA_ORIENTATION=+
MRGVILGNLTTLRAGVALGAVLGRSHQQRAELAMRNRGEAAARSDKHDAAFVATAEKATSDLLKVLEGGYRVQRASPEAVPQFQRPAKVGAALHDSSEGDGGSGSSFKTVRLPSSSSIAAIDTVRTPLPADAVTEMMRGADACGRLEDEGLSSRVQLPRLLPATLPTPLSSTTMLTRRRMSMATTPSSRATAGRGTSSILGAPPAKWLVTAEAGDAPAATRLGRFATYAAMCSGILSSMSGAQSRIRWHKCQNIGWRAYIKINGVKNVFRAMHCLTGQSDPHLS